MSIPRASTFTWLKRHLRGFAVVGLAAVSMLAWTGVAQAQSSPSIVGFWHFKLIQQDGTLYYQSIQQYHADGLEMEDAATPPTHPAHVCMGVWKQDGNAVQIYHVIWTYNGDKPPVGYVVLTENNTLSQDGNSLTGTYTVKEYDIKDGHLTGQGTGTTVARRIDFDHPFGLFSAGAVAPNPWSTVLGYAGEAAPAC